jgi:DNA-binding NarL/FixJ family response regulator
MTNDPCPIRILCVDDHALVRDGIASLLGSQEDMHGIDAMIAILNNFPNARFIVLTTYSGDVEIVRALRAGAQAYLLKGHLRKELFETIRNVHDGRRRIPPEIASQIANHTADSSLSIREIDVLQLIAAGNANKLVADKLSISEDTVKGHVKSILSKLDAHDRTHAVTIAMKRGIIEL